MREKEEADGQNFCQKRFLELPGTYLADKNILEFIRQCKLTLENNIQTFPNAFINLHYFDGHKTYSEKQPQ